MGNCIIASPNYVDTAAKFATVSFSGGLWKPTLPLTNLRSRFLTDVARSINATNAATRFVVDLGSPRDVQVIAMPNAVVSRNATARVRGYSDAARTTLVCDTGVREWYPVVYPFGTLPFGHPSFFDGKLGAEEADGYPIPWLYVFDAPQVAQYWLIEVFDETNEAAYIDLTRLILAPGWQPTINMEWGAAITWEDTTQVEVTPGGTKFYDVRQKRRVISFSLANIPENEMLARGFDLAFRQGIDQQVFVVFNPADTYHLHRRAFLGTLRQIPSFSFPYFKRMKADFTIEEVIGG